MQIVGSTINELMPGFVGKTLGEEGQRAGLLASDVQSVYVPCLVFSHQDAREIGKAWSADIVMCHSIRQRLAPSTAAAS